MDVENDVPVLKLTSSYAYRERKSVANRFHLREGLVGQCALEKKPILLTRVPPDYIQINSGLGESARPPGLEPGSRMLCTSISSITKPGRNFSLRPPAEVFFRAYVESD